MPRKEGIDDVKFELPTSLHERLKKACPRKGQKSKILRALIEDFVRKVERNERD